MRTHEVASQAGVNQQTLRYYERIGLLPDPPRTPSGYRDYPPDVVRTLRSVRRAKELGFQLEEIRELLGFEAHRAGSCAAARALAEHRVADLERRIEDLTRMRDALAGLADRCTPESEQVSRHGCPVLEVLDEA